MSNNNPIPNFETVGFAAVERWSNPRRVRVAGNMVALTVNNCDSDCSTCRRRVSQVSGLLEGKPHRWHRHNEVVLFGYDGSITADKFLTRELGIPVVI
ncbi:hypothetical protein IPM19_01815 [bacterium]|nr:MAG: hypothetical protein IPM19_01815 [bacterium]